MLERPRSRCQQGRFHSEISPCRQPLSPCALTQPGLDPFCAGVQERAISLVSSKNTNPIRRPHPHDLILTNFYTNTMGLGLQHEFGEDINIQAIVSHFIQGFSLFFFGINYLQGFSLWIVYLFSGSSFFFFLNSVTQIFYRCLVNTCR